MDKVFIFKDVNHEFRWHRRSDNNRIIADSGESYKNKSDCVEMALKVNAPAEFYLEGVLLEIGNNEEDNVEQEEG